MAADGRALLGAELDRYRASVAATVAGRTDDGSNPLARYDRPTLRLRLRREELELYGDPRERGPDLTPGWTDTFLDSVTLCVMWADLLVEHDTWGDSELARGSRALREFLSLVDERLDPLDAIEPEDETEAGLLARALERRHLLHGEVLDVLRRVATRAEQATSVPPVTASGRSEAAEAAAAATAAAAAAVEQVATDAAACAGDVAPRAEGADDVASARRRVRAGPPVPLERVVGPAAAELTEHLVREDTAGELAVEVSAGDARSLTAQELEALGVTGDATSDDASPERALFRASAALTWRVAREFGRIPGLEPVSPPGDPSRAEAADALECLCDALVVVLTVARNQQRHVWLRTIDPVARRLEALLASVLEHHAGELAEHARHRFVPSFSPEDFRATAPVGRTKAPVERHTTGTAARRTTAAVSGRRTATAPVRSSRGRAAPPIVVLPERRQLVQLGAIVVVVCSAAAYMLWSTRAYWVPQRPQHVELAELGTWLPRPELLELTRDDRARRWLRVEVGVEWGELSADEQHRRLMKACELLSRWAYEGADILDFQERLLARWEGGHLRLGPAAAQTADGVER